MAITKQEETEYLARGGVSCPKCRSQNISGGFIEVAQGQVRQRVSCPNCETQWTDLYCLAGIEETELDTIEPGKSFY